MAKDTKPKILQAARQLFMQQGYAGTSMGSIAKLAGVNHSLLFHHFGNKAHLWTAVKHDIVDEAGSEEALLPSVELAWPDFVAELFKLSLDFYRGNEDILRLLRWQHVETIQELDDVSVHNSYLEAWYVAFKHYQSTGDIAEGHNANTAIQFVLSLTSSLVLDPKPLLQEKGESAYLDFCQRCFMKGLKPTI